SSTTTSTGMPLQVGDVTGLVVSASFWMLGPPTSPQPMPELIRPEKAAARRPFLKLNSATAFFFSASGNSFSFDIPARPTMTMPASEIRTPTKDTMPDFESKSCPNSPRRILGTSVPAAEQMPQPRARPRPTPRKRIINPHVSPPTPHIAPQRKQYFSSLPGAFLSTVSRFGEVANARIHGTSTNPK